MQVKTSRIRTHALLRGLVRRWLEIGSFKERAMRTVARLCSLTRKARSLGIVRGMTQVEVDIQILRAHIASGPERNEGWLRAIFDPQMGTALSAIPDRVNTPWTVDSLAGAAGMSRSAFAARFKELFGQTQARSRNSFRLRRLNPGVFKFRLSVLQSAHWRR
jgi:AraC-like DNA-binding protein